MMSGEAPPGVLVYRSIAEAAAHLQGTLGEDGSAYHPDLAALAKQHGGAFFVTLRLGFLHESDSSREAVYAVFVQPKRVTVVPRLIERIISIPSMCGNPNQNEPLDIGFTDPHVGHIRVVRSNVDDTPTLPAVASQGSGRCNCTHTFRVEDHFIDLDSGQHLRTLRQVYRGPCYEPPPASPALPFAAFTVVDGKLEVANTACSYFWDD